MVFAQTVNKEIKENEGTTETLKEQLLIFEEEFGQAGIKLLIEIFQQDDINKIVENYAQFEDFVLKKFGIELFISQQMDKIYLLTLFAHSDILKNDHGKYFIDIHPLNKYTLNHIAWFDPYKDKRVNIYFNPSDTNVLVFNNSDVGKKHYQTFISLRLLFLLILSSFDLVSYLLDREYDIVFKHQIGAEANFQKIRNEIRRCDINRLIVIRSQIEATRDLIEAKMDIVSQIKTVVMADFMKMKRTDTLLINMLSKKYRDGDKLITGAKHADLPEILNMKLPSVMIKELYKKVNFSERYLIDQQKTHNEIIDDTFKLEKLKKDPSKEEEMLKLVNKISQDTINVKNSFNEAMLKYNMKISSQKIEFNINFGNEFKHELHETLIQSRNILEQNRNSYVDFDEEKLRSETLGHLKMKFNNLSEGEVFSCNGKTDIHVKDPKNSFDTEVIECKIWSGEKYYLEGIEQAEGYAPKRDKSIIMLIFCRNKSFEEIGNKAREAITKLGNFKEESIVDIKPSLDKHSTDFYGEVFVSEEKKLTKRVYNYFIDLSV
ncbi:hypothetical protein GF327_05965 [Candidatus Woesearchaeota archaeon]|nr:hypothetical protein [Candidatus Woesearchaeota archaeon]